VQIKCEAELEESVASLGATSMAMAGKRVGKQKELAMIIKHQ